VALENGAIIFSHLVLKAKVPGISKEKFDECAADAKANCPISKLLNTEIKLEASLLP
jgi:osmotically inducible protein OsmC